MDGHQVSDHKVDGAHVPEFHYDWDMEDDQQGINGDDGEDQRDGCDGRNGGKDQQSNYYKDKDQQGIHNDRDDEDEGQCSQPNHHHAQHLLSLPPCSCADSVVPVTVDGASGAVEPLGERPNRNAVHRGNELVSTPTLFPCSLHLIFFCRLGRTMISLTVTI